MNAGTDDKIFQGMKAHIDILEQQKLDLVEALRACRSSLNRWSRTDGCQDCDAVERHDIETDMIAALVGARATLAKVQS